MKFIFIADFFADEILGGGELNNEVLAEVLRNRGHEVIEQKSNYVTEEYINDHLEYFFVVSNFVNLLEDAKQALQALPYVIYEHDHKYLRSRNPAVYPKYIAPASEIVNRDFYKNALGIFCQSSLHCDIVHKNLGLDNIKNLSGNVWSDEALNYIETLCANPKTDQFSVMNSSIAHKNTLGAVRYCDTHDFSYELIGSNDYYGFLKQLSGNKKFAFLPQTPETLSRVVVEARMMGVEVHTNNRVGAASEKWFSLKGKDLIQKMRQRREAIATALEDIFTTGRCSRTVEKEEIPKISLITSLYNGDNYIVEFLNNICLQSVFDRCELIIIDANSPGNEYQVIKRYAERHPNIIYRRLDEDPGIYGCWNEALKLATGEFISNANLDDRRSLQQLELFAQELVDNPDIDLVYSRCFVTHRPNETYADNSSGGSIYPVADFTSENMIKCLPGCMPLWRKSMHDKAGVFDDKYKFAGDWEMWLRAVQTGSKFKRVEGVHGLYYHNPNGLTTDTSRQQEKFAEEKEVFHRYADIFGQENYDLHKEYFSK